MSDVPSPKLGLDVIGKSARAARRRPVRKAVRKEVAVWEEEHRKSMAELHRAIVKEVHEQRKEYAVKLFKMTRTWLAVLLLVVIADGWTWGLFKLSDPVMLALLGGTTVSVLGLFIFVLKHMFPDPATKRHRK